MREMLRKMNLQLFADDPDPNAGDDGGNNQDGAGDNAGSGKDGTKTFTQEDVDAILQKRLARERKQWEQQLEEERKKAAMTEAERLKAEKEEVEKRAQAVMESANQRLIRAEVVAQAASMGIVDADAAYALMDRDGIEVDEQGNVKGVSGALEALLKAKPYLKGQQVPGQSGSGGFNGSDTGEKNPWSKEHFNLTEQGRIMRENPKLADQLKREAKGK